MVLLQLSCSLLSYSPLSCCCCAVAAVCCSFLVGCNAATAVELEGLTGRPVMSSGAHSLFVLHGEEREMIDYGMSGQGVCFATCEIISKESSQDYSMLCR